MWAEAHGWRIGYVFEELAPTQSAAGDSRLRAALERVESGETDGLIVARLKHLGNSLGEVVGVLERIQAAGGTFVSVRDGFDLGSPSGRLMLRVLVSVLRW
jgi:DNA invertase Pin-like site-specific DNA recombinase